ncbi:ABC transporter substrate-binding protein [Mesorhizobium amorphae]|uniref:Twin-arginine translocation pathway signal n=1 Tax=Mesorhizobium amorphae CCNWGS0123 TaxID=1082933 RepID=G6Y3E4_9HYPH|nr:ABC transporter substrate-binding protein [Mesorhizobium amorphae]ANT54895.1 peptide ABC transporter substrate-binding protein [Mesorhizobium amorphae CCNWGS0123]EHH13734.1 twin-arginine translocation pathway signal [Mesorhizobium amorphae CCNWGS0123]
MVKGYSFSSLTALSRRRFLQSAAGAGALAVGSAAGLLPSLAETATPKKGGHFKIGVGSGSASDSLNPATYTDSFMMIFGHALHGYLVEMDRDGNLVGELAESWESSKDAKTWTFKLREGVEFHNGKKLDADDVVASLNHHRGEQSGSGAKDIVKGIEEIHADGPRTVVLSLKGANADFPYLMEHYQLPIMPAKDGKADISGVGCGGYVLDKIDFGVKATAKRFANYWKPNAAWFDSFEVLAIHDVGARTNALTTGQIQAMDRCDLKTINLLKRNKSLEITSISGTQQYVMPMRCDVSPFDNVDVRLAVKYALNRKQLLDTLLNGYGQLGNDHPIASTNRFFAKGLPQREQDLDKARFHLKKAGVTNLKVQLSASDAAFTGAVDAAALYQQDAAKVGINVDIVREPADGYWDSVWLKKPWYTSFTGGRPTADWMFSVFYAADASWNEGHWKNPRFNELLIAARGELDDSKRLEMYTEMQSLCREDSGSVIPVFANYVNALSTNVGHNKIGSNWDLDSFRCAERWWLTNV